MVLKRRNGQCGNTLRILDRATHKWKDIASLICSDDASKVCTLEQSRDDPRDSLRRVLIDCFIENEPRGYSQDWNGLIEVFNDAGLKGLAKDVKLFKVAECS